MLATVIVGVCMALVPPWQIATRQLPVFDAAFDPERAGEYAFIGAPPNDQKTTRPRSSGRLIDSCRGGSRWQG